MENEEPGRYGCGVEGPFQKTRDGAARNLSGKTEHKNAIRQKNPNELDLG